MSTVDETPGALQSWGLSKQYDGSAPAVRDLSLFVPAGTLYGLVGPNGAGKTTFLSMATGIVRPSAGQVWIDGHDVWADPVGAHCTTSECCTVSIRRWRTNAARNCSRCWTSPRPVTARSPRTAPE